MPGKEFTNKIEKVIFDSGFGESVPRKEDQKELYLSKAQALKHPNWNMGAKVTIDSGFISE